MGELLYSKGDPSPDFYFLLKGKIEIMAESYQQQELKFSKHVDEFEFFGIKSAITDCRHDYAKAITDKCWVLLINKEQYE